jgi:hypothetical protein
MGNGFPDVGDYVAGNDGNLYRVTEMGRRIQTGSPGAPNYIEGCTVELADWDDTESDDDVHPCSCSVAAES